MLTSIYAKVFEKRRRSQKGHVTSHQGQSIKDRRGTRGPHVPQMWCNSDYYLQRYGILKIFILVLIVFLSLSTAEEMFSPRNYTFHRGKKSFLRGENIIPWNSTFHRGEKSCEREPRYGCAQPRMWMQCVHG